MKYLDLEYHKKYREANKDLMKHKAKLYREKNKERIKELRDINKDKVKDYNKKYRENNKEKNIEYQKEYRENNKDNRRKYALEYVKNRMNSDPVYKLSHNIKSLIRSSLTNMGFSKKSRTHEILGCSSDNFYIHIISQFEDWMNFDNHGLYNGKLNYGWDLDHIIPISSAITEEDIIKLNHYTNLQPLCSYKNRYIKKNNI